MAAAAPGPRNRATIGRPISPLEEEADEPSQPLALLPLLDGFGQDVRINGDGGPLAHVLTVFLIDPRGVAREIYSTAYPYPQVLLADLETLRLEAMARDAMTARPGKSSRRGN